MDVGLVFGGGVSWGVRGGIGFKLDWDCMMTKVLWGDVAKPAKGEWKSVRVDIIVESMFLFRGRFEQVTGICLG